MDAAREAAPEQLVRAAIESARAATQAAYARADAAALRHQRRHAVIVGFVAVTGTLAVVMGSISLTQPAGREAVRITEAFAAAAAIVAVVLGIWAGAQRRWLLERHKAELLRLMGFRALLRFAAGDGHDAERWEATLHADVARLEARSNRELARWAGDETASEPVPDVLGGAPMSALPALIVEGYARSAVEAQCAYFRRRASTNERWDKRTRGAIPILFFVSVSAIIPGSILRLSGDAAHAAGWISLAVIAPALAAGIRLFRSANEFGRNGVRFRAKALVLAMLADRLARATAPDELLHALHDAVRLFEAEHREWLQLMLEAEWYG